MQLAPAENGCRLRRVYSLSELVPVHIHGTNQLRFAIQVRSIKSRDIKNRSAERALKNIVGYTKTFNTTARRIDQVEFHSPA